MAKLNLEQQRKMDEWIAILRERGYSEDGVTAAIKRAADAEKAALKAAKIRRKKRFKVEAPAPLAER